MGRPLFQGRVPKRTRAVARHLVLGWSNQAIAHELGIRPQTVRNYVKEIFDAAGAETRTQAVEVILASEKMLKEIYGLERRV